MKDYQVNSCVFCILKNKTKSTISFFDLVLSTMDEQSFWILTRKVKLINLYWYRVKSCCQHFMNSRLYLFHTQDVSQYHALFSSVKMAANSSQSAVKIYQFDRVSENSKTLFVHCGKNKIKETYCWFCLVFQNAKDRWIYLIILNTAIRLFEELWQE